jgi:microcystin-dependent protein
MVEPLTPNVNFTVPSTGDLPGAWGTSALNPNFTAIDGMFAGVTTISLTNSNVTLTAPAGTVTPGAGPNQSQNAVIFLTGTLSGNPTITLPLPGFVIFKNNCTVGSNYVTVRALGTGNVIGLPPGQACHVYNDGTNADYVNLGMVGSYLDLAVTTTPAWMSACTIAPYLICNGLTYSTATFAALSAMLGSTFGGNGVNTFGVPDLQNRIRVALATSGVARLTSGGSGVDGTALGANGGAQNQSTVIAHRHSVVDPGHVHTIFGAAQLAGVGGGININSVSSGGSDQTTQSHTTGITLATTGSATNMVTVQPTLVAGITFIKT